MLNLANVLTYKHIMILQRDKDSSLIVSLILVGYNYTYMYMHDVFQIHMYICMYHTVQILMRNIEEFDKFLVICQNFSYQVFFLSVAIHCGGSHSFVNILFVKFF